MINNDEGLYNLALEAIKRTRNRHQAALYFLGKVEPATPDGAPYSVATIKAAMVGM